MQRPRWEEYHVSSMGECLRLPSLPSELVWFSLAVVPSGASDPEAQDSRADLSWPCENSAEAGCVRGSENSAEAGCVRGSRL